MGGRIPEFGLNLNSTPIHQGVQQIYENGLHPFQWLRKEENPSLSTMADISEEESHESGFSGNIETMVAWQKS